MSRAAQSKSRAFWPSGLRIGGAALLVPILVFLLVFFVYPLVSVLSISIFDRSGTFTLQYYTELFSGGRVANVMLTTVRIAAITTLFTLILSYPVAYFLATTARSTKNLILIIVLLPFWTSVLVRAFAWMLLFGRNGVINSTMTQLGLIDVPIDMLFSFFSVLVGLVHALMPFAVLTMLATMQNVDRNLHAASATLGAQSGDAFWRVFFPISFPGVASAALITFIVSLGTFIQSALLGSPRETMIAQVIIEEIDVMANWGMAGALSVMVLVLSIIFILIFDKMFGIASISGTSQSGGASGKAMRAITAGLGRVTVAVQGVLRSILPKRKIAISDGRKPILTLTTFLIVAFLAVPSFFLIPVSFTGGNFLEWPPRGFSLQWYDAYFSSSIWRDATVRSIVVGIVTAIASLIIGVPAAFALNRAKFKGKGFVLPYILLPVVAPNIIVALALFYFFARIGLVGTSTGLIIGHTIFSVPYVVLTMIATLQNYDQRLDHAAWTLGARPLTTFRIITLPLIKVGFAASFLFAFVRSFDELTVALFISSGTTTTLPKKMWSDAHVNVGPTLAAVSTILIVMVALVIITTELLGRRSRAVISKEGD